MDTNPLNNLPRLVSKALSDAGWKSGVVRPRSSRCADEHLLAKHLLDELEGLEVRPLGQGVACRPLRVHFEQSIAEGYGDEIRELEKRLHVRLAPIANVGNGVAIMLLSDTGHVLLLGYADKGVLLAGHSFGEAMRRTIAGESNRPLIFADDPHGRFWNDQVNLSDPDAYKLGPNGLHDSI